MEYVAVEKKNYEICRQGDDADVFYIIISGTFQVTIDGKAVAVLGELDIFGESALFTDGNGASRRGATVTTTNDAIVKVQVLALHRKRFDKLIASGTLSEDCVNKLKRVAESRQRENERMKVGEYGVSSAAQKV